MFCYNSVLGVKIFIDQNVFIYTFNVFCKTILQILFSANYKYF